MVCESYAVAVGAMPCHALTQEPLKTELQWSIRLMYVKLISHVVDCAINQQGGATCVMDVMSLLVTVLAAPVMTATCQCQSLSLLTFQVASSTRLVAYASLKAEIMTRNLSPRPLVYFRVV